MGDHVMQKEPDGSPEEESPAAQQQKAAEERKKKSLDAKPGQAGYQTRTVQPKPATSSSA
jgi:hypothetical protein